MLGGVYQQDTEQDGTKVLLLADIPVLGRLFRDDKDNTNRRELLIFVTPKSLQEGLKVN